MSKYKGILRAISGETYGIFIGKNAVFSFEVKNVKKRKKIDVLQGSKVDFDKDIAPLLK